MEEGDIPQQQPSTATKEPPLPWYKQVLKWTIILFIAATLGYIGKCNIDKDKLQANVLQKHIEDSLKKSYDAIIQSKESQILSLDKNISDLTDSNMALKTDIAYYTVQINQIKTQTHVKIVYVSKLSSDSLAMFFANRYKH